MFSLFDVVPGWHPADVGGSGEQERWEVDGATSSPTEKYGAGQNMA